MNNSAVWSLQANGENHIGISRGLGLGVSYPPDQIPALPAPRSWTPSPPFNPNEIQIQPLTQPPAQQVSHSYQQQPLAHACVQSRSTPTCLPSRHAPTCLLPRSTPVGTNPQSSLACTQPGLAVGSHAYTQPNRATHVPPPAGCAGGPAQVIARARLRKYRRSPCTSPYNPRHNTPNTDRSSLPDTFSSSSGSTPSKYTNMTIVPPCSSSSSDYSFEVIGTKPRKIPAEPRSPMKVQAARAPRRRTRKHRPNLSTTEASSASGGNRRLRVPVLPARQPSTEKSPSLLRGAATGELACACSSHPCLLPRSDNDLPFLSSRSAHLRDLSLEPLQSSGAARFSDARRPALRHYNTPVARPKASTGRGGPNTARMPRSRRSKACRPTTSSRSSWRRFPTSNYLGTYLPSSMPHLYPPAPSDAMERELERRLALKYGFCVTCGIYTEHQQRFELGLARSTEMRRNEHRRKRSRHTQTRWTDWNNNEALDDVTQDLALSSMPSLSWDNLTPDPSPALLTDTLGDTAAAEAAAALLEAGDREAASLGWASHGAKEARAAEKAPCPSASHKARGRRRSRPDNCECTVDDSDECLLVNHK
ncbi:histone-lysine N-methyltransferase 2D-like isoform X2 [Penaeus japonicus]|uniref:histone-lysine N-methyltransferase 2D-like isoform X2 n=1 Tax=Penaeus japonicus TaxID=27405 RepID=UPI001C7125C8|nr:histone-lysine N-methyltransferase 2D-like isoform X2 [Penaeus japonicus]